MSQIGADPEYLHSLSNAFMRATNQLANSRGVIDSQLRRTHWHGTDAERFRASWATSHRTALNSTADTCRVIGKQLEQQARQQMTASAEYATAGSGTSVGGITGRTIGGRTSSSDRTSASASGPSASLPTTFFADRTLTIKLGSEVTVASVLVGSDRQFSIESRGDNRIVNVSDFDGAGIKASFGGSLSVGPVGEADLSASVKGLVGTATTRTFKTNAAGLNTTLIGIATRYGIERAVDSLGPGGVSIPGAGRLTGLLLDRLGGALGVIPTPERSETLTVFALGGKAGATIPVAGGADVSASGVLRVGTAQTASTTSYIVEAQGAAAYSLPAALGLRNVIGSTDASPTAAGVTSAGVPSAGAGRQALASLKSTEELKGTKVRIEIIPDDKSPRAVVTTEQRDTSGLKRSVTQVDLRDAGRRTAVQSVKSIIDSARSGRVGRAWELLSDLELPDGMTSTQSAAFAVDTNTHSMGFSAGEGLTVAGEANARIERTTLTN